MSTLPYDPEWLAMAWADVEKAVERYRVIQALTK